MLSLLRTSTDLLPYVDAYLCVRDADPPDHGRAIDTAPRPGGVLTVNLGTPNRTAGGALTPVLSILGVQTRGRSWRAEENTHFVMALLTPAGIARLAPGAGTVTVDSFLELGALVGDSAAASLLADASGRPEAVTATLDTWLLKRLLVEHTSLEMAFANAACAALARSSRVDTAAECLGISRRHLTRVVSGHLGIGPNELLDLHRLDRSLRAVQAGADSLVGFADQAHQICEWRRRLDTTPGRYSRTGRSRLAEKFGSAMSGPAFYL